MSNQINSNSELLSRKQVAELCSVSTTTIWRWMKAGKISYLKIGRRVLFSRSQVISDLMKFQTNEAA